ncbi:hypothetical protein [Legionella impletisoli]|uniref:Glycosyl transferases group 1 n=1 Tax=Legionella impletisoli TaxID=343510 RepID=A0A917JSE6_9GAMM|nr:hypothetical protein [Legionella impletisoli]GGI80148.1 hypothetical protein GCM10007966_05810 [Legionella impletisoli]
MKLNILLLCNKPNAGSNANTVVDHIESIQKYSEGTVWLCSVLGHLPKTLQLNKFDVIIIHYSLSLLQNYYLNQEAKTRIHDYEGLKVVFVQDEYRQINKLIDELNFLKADILFSCFPENELNKIYPPDKLLNTKVVNNLTGYLPQRLLDIGDLPPTKDRTIHVGYRGRKLPFWYGELAYEKWSIVDKWHQFTKNAKLNVDISYNENKRIYGHKWIEFLLSCKATLGVESGASVMDFTGELEKVIDLHQLTHPNDSFHTVQKKYLLEHEGKYKLNQISPRCFEAIALKTVLVLYEGEYSEILIPNHHYIPLKKDFSNIEQVLMYLEDDQFLQAMADRAFNEIALNPEYSYKSFVKSVDAIIIQEFITRNKSKVREVYSIKEFERDIRHVSFKNRIYRRCLTMYQKSPNSLRLIVKGCCRPKFAMLALTKILFKMLRPISK